MHGGFVGAWIYRASEVLVRWQTITYRKSLLKGSLLDIVVIYAEGEPVRRGQE